MAAISAQAAEYSLSMSAKHHLGFEILSDAGNLAARQYGLVFSLAEPLRVLYKEKFGIEVQTYNADKSYDLPMPGTFVVAPNGIINCAFVNPDYTLRLEPAEILKSLQEIAGT